MDTGTRATSRFDSLAVRLVASDELSRFNALLDEHHYLGHHLFGRILRYVATIDGEWVALIGFGSAALSLGPRERFVGWNEEAKLRRLRFVSNNQRFCVLPSSRIPNLASAVLSRTLSRLSDDAEAAYGNPVLLVETFTDPARHRGTCYKAANFHLAGMTSGFGRKSGSWVHHGQKKCCWLYPLHKHAAALLRAEFDHPLLVSALSRRRRQMVDLNAVVIDGEGGLYTKLCALPDHRKPKGVRHKLAAILLVCAAAVLCDAKGPTEIAEWAADLDQEARERLHCRRHPLTGRLVVPSYSTIQRTLNKVDKEAFDRVVNETVYEQVKKRASAKRDALAEPSSPVANEEAPAPLAGDDAGEVPGVDDCHDDSRESDAPAPRCLAVDGKSLRGALQDDGRLLHLLSVLTHEERVVIGQEEVDHKTNEILHFRPLLEPLDIKGHLVTADALHTQREHAKFLSARGADYLFYADGNQPKLYEAISSIPDETWSAPFTETGKGHGRIEARTIWTTSTLPETVTFPHVAQLVRIMREVDDAKTKTARHTETVYALTSSATASPKVLLHASRGHWGVESLHWVRDATMREDASKVRSGSAPRVLATLRNLAIGVLRLAGVSNVAKSLRTLSRRPELALSLLGL